MELTDDELYEIYTLVYEELYYGDYDVVYGHDGQGFTLRAGLEKLNEEINRRGLR